MMPASIVHRLRVLAIFAFCGVLSACCSLNKFDKALAEGDEVWCQPDGDGFQWCRTVEKTAPICPTDYTIVQCFFHDYDRRSSTQEQRKELRRALRDLLELPLEELQKPRYADYDGVPGQWSIVEILRSYLGSWAWIRGWGQVRHDTEGFVQSLKLPESVPAIKKVLSDVDESITCEEADECYETVW